MKYRKKPIVIDAFQYKGNGNFENPDLPYWIWMAFETGVLWSKEGQDPLLIKTLEGSLSVSPDDWIIRGVNGELYPCKPDIFEKTYEAAQEQKQDELWGEVEETIRLSVGLDPYRSNKIVDYLKSKFTLITNNKQ
jgi:hypothetical protein